MIALRVSPPLKCPLNGKPCEKYVFQLALAPNPARLCRFMYSASFFIQKMVFSGTGPKLNSYQNLSMCHWNLVSFAIHSFVKVSLLKAYIIIYNLDTICISDTYLDSSIAPDNSNLGISDCDLIRADYPSNNK